jgi:hypothetical protein
MSIMDFNDAAEALDEIIDLVRAEAAAGDPDGASDFLENAIERLTVVAARVNA